MTMLKWSMYAGGTGAEPGKHGYDSHTRYGDYQIQPVSNSRGRHVCYLVHFINDAGALSGGLWQTLSKVRHPNVGKGICLKHYKLHFAKR